MINGDAMSYTELQVTTNFSFLRGASHPGELVEQAAAGGYRKIAITDHNTLAGVVRAHVAAKANGIILIPGARLDLLDGPSLLAYPTDKESYGLLSLLLTTGNRRTEKGKCELFKRDVYQHAKGLRFIALAPGGLTADFEIEPGFIQHLREYREALGSSLYLAATRRYNGDDHKQLFCLNELGGRLGVPLIATNDVHYHHPSRRPLQDILTCVREKCTIHNAGFRLYSNAERHLKTIDEMQRLFRQYPDAIRRTTELAEACQFSLDQLVYLYPKEVTAEGRTPDEELRHLVFQGLKERLGDSIPEKIEKQINYELAFIERKNISEYFITVEDICREARRRRILYQGRGSAANCACCYYLGITNVDPSKFDLFFERFLSDARDEPPDIDVDFEHERREEIIQYIYQKYGRDRAAIVATVTQQHLKGAIKDVGKAMGLSVDTIDQLAGALSEDPASWLGSKRLVESGMDLKDPHLRKVLELTSQFMGFPRQLGQHTGGFVITQGRLTDICPILNARMADRTNIEWNKDDIDALGCIKIDVLALGMLTCIRKAFDLAREHYGLSLTLANIPQDDPKVYEMVSAADTIGLFQIESRAQQSMLPRLRPKTFYDLVIEVAIVRPGPIQGDMVHPYLRRRNGLEKVEYPSKELEEILSRTLGVPLFQEQAMKIAVVAAGFTPTEADELRRSMATFKLPGQVVRFQEKLVNGMVSNGYTKEYALRVFKQLEGFGSYGFPESHAASFALLVYVSAWLKCYYPDVFAAAILNSLPMGFYQPAQLVSDARQHGVEFRPVDVNHSVWNYILEERNGKFYILRMGFRQVGGLREEEMLLLMAGRTQPYTSIPALLDAGVSPATLERLANADAFRSMGLDRRQALWEVAALADRPIGLFQGQASESEWEGSIPLPVMTDSEHVVQDYANTSLSLKAHPVSFVRAPLRALGNLSSQELSLRPTGQYVKVAGLVLVRQRPGTAKGVCFITLEDETGTMNLIVWASLFKDFRKEILQSKLLMVEGNLQIADGVTHVIVQRCHNLTGLLARLTPAQNQDLPVLTLSRADEKSDPVVPDAERRVSRQVLKQASMFPEGRNFK